MPSRSNRISDSFFGELMLNSSPDELVDASGEPRQLLIDALRLRTERRRVDPHAGALDLDEHRDERLLELVVHPLQLVLLQQRLQRRRQLQREVGPLAGVVERAVDGDVGERDGLGAAPADVFFAERLVADVLDRQILERMREFASSR